MAFKTGHDDAKKMGFACYSNLQNRYAQLLSSYNEDFLAVG